MLETQGVKTAEAIGATTIVTPGDQRPSLVAHLAMDYKGGSEPEREEGDRMSLNDSPEQQADMQQAQSAGAMLLSLSATALLAACGGGDEPPAALRNSGAAVAMPDLLTTAGSRRTRLAARLPTVDELMNWGESQYRDLFPGHQSNQFLDEIIYRYYPGTGNYLGVQGSAVLVLGPVSGGVLAQVGVLADFAALVFASSGGRVDSDEAAARFLHHAAFGANDADIAAVRSKGYAGWLEEQLNMPLGQSKWDWLVGKGYSEVNNREYFFNDYYYQFAIWRDMLTAPDMVRQRWALALSEMFVISVNSVSGTQPWSALGGAHFWDTLARHGFGNFRNLLEAVTLHPVMGAFLNTRGNQKEDASTGRVPDENYAREVMQLFTIGLHHLNQDGTPRLGGNGQPVDTYTQSDVTNLARVFTGYDVDMRGLGTITNPNPPHQTGIFSPGYLLRPMRFDASRHSTLESKR